MYGLILIIKKINFLLRAIPTYLILVFDGTTINKLINIYNLFQNECL